MIKRVIGGVGFVLIFYGSLLLGNAFFALLAVFLIAGLLELKNIYSKTSEKTKTILYSVAYIMFILGLGYVSRINAPFIIYFTVLLMLNDVLAYAVGVSIGKRKLSKISPNKTIEGSIGGILLSPFATILVMYIVEFGLSGLSLSFVPFDFSTLGNYNPFATLIMLVIVSFVIAILGQVGDLVESYFKRSSGIKDSGKIVYGHGGILDRVDSWIFPIILITLIMLII